MSSFARLYNPPRGPAFSPLDESHPLFLFVTQTRRIKKKITPLATKISSKKKSAKKVGVGKSTDPNHVNLHDIGGDDYSFTTNDDILKKSSKRRRKKKSGGGETRIGDRFGLGGGSVVTALDDRIAEFDMSSKYGGGGSVAEGRGGGAAAVVASRLSSDTSVLETDQLRMAQRRTYEAPPGKLGVAIDSINGQPVVHRIKEGSPLEGVLRRLDRIVGIDDVDTSRMSAADVTYLMVKSMNRPRLITYIRDERA